MDLTKFISNDSELVEENLERMFDMTTISRIVVDCKTMVYEGYIDNYVDYYSDESEEEDEIGLEIYFRPLTSALYVRIQTTEPTDVIVEIARMLPSDFTKEQFIEVAQAMQEKYGSI